jgi:hypothetical protein
MFHGSVHREIDDEQAHGSMAREERRHCRRSPHGALRQPQTQCVSQRQQEPFPWTLWTTGAALHCTAAPRPTDRPIRLSMNPAACAICTLPQSSRARRIWVPAAYLTRSVFRLHGTLLPCPLSSGHAMRAVPAPRCRSHSRRGTPRCQVRLPAAPQRRP